MAGEKKALDTAISDEERFDAEVRAAEDGQQMGFSMLQDLVPVESGEFERRRPGRPKGSANRTTKDTIRLLRAQGCHSPLEAAARIYSRPTAVLAEELGCKRAEAAALQVRMIDASLPYWHSKQPVEVVAPNGQALPLVQINMGNPDAVSEEVTIIPGHKSEVEENQ